MFLVLAILSLSMCVGLCDTVPDLEQLQGDIITVDETCSLDGFKRQIATGSQAIAFDAGRRNQIKKNADKKWIVFETVHMNQGQGYDATNGVFKAPIGGTYVFYWTNYAARSLPFISALILNEQRKSWNDCYTDNSRMMCTKMAVLELQKGDSVWVAVYHDLRDYRLQFASFTGFKL